MLLALCEHLNLLPDRTDIQFKEHGQRLNLALFPGPTQLSVTCKKSGRSLGTRLCSASVAHGESLGTRLCSASVAHGESLGMRLCSASVTHGESLGTRLCSASVAHGESLGTRLG